MNGIRFAQTTGPMAPWVMMTNGRTVLHLPTIDDNGWYYVREVVVEGRVLDWGRDCR